MTVEGDKAKHAQQRHHALASSASPGSSAVDERSRLVSSFDSGIASLCTLPHRIVDPLSHPHFYANLPPSIAAPPHVAFAEDRALKIKVSTATTPMTRPGGEGVAVPQGGIIELPSFILEWLVASGCILPLAPEPSPSSAPLAPLAPPPLP